MRPLDMLVLKCVQTCSYVTMLSAHDKLQFVKESTAQHVFGHQNELNDPEVDGAKAPPHKCSICDLSMALPMHSARHHRFGNYHSLEGINFTHDTSLK